MKIQVINNKFVLSTKSGVKTFNTKRECSDFIAKTLKH